MARYIRRRNTTFRRPVKRIFRRKTNTRVFRKRPRKMRRIPRYKGSARRAYGIGDHRIVKCVYRAQIPINPPVDQTAVQSASVPICINSAWDPWTGVTGNYNRTVAGYHLYSKMYSRYAVLGAKITATFRPVVVGTADYPFKVILKKYLSTEGTSMANWPQYCSDPDSVTGDLVSSPKQPTQRTLTMKYSPYKEFGIRDITDTAYSDGIFANIDSDPTRKYYVLPLTQCTFGNLNGPQNWVVDVVLRQTVMFTDRKDLTNLPAAADVIQDI